MKLTGLLFVALLAGLTNLSIAQDWSTDTYQYGEQYPGYVIDVDGVKTEGFIKYRNRSVMQEEVIFYGKKDNSSTKEKYMPNELQSYQIGDKVYHIVNYSGDVNFKPRALLVKQGEGCIKEYVWYELASGYNTLKKRPGETSEEFGNRKFPSKSVYHKEGDGVGVDNDFFSGDFKKKVATYVKTDKGLSKKVKSGTSGYSKPSDLKAIFSEFNKNCGN